MNWIYYYIERDQTELPSISKTPYDVLEDLIYKNSNKFYDVLNKDFYNNLDKYFNTKQSFNEKIENYKRTEAYKDWIDYLTRVNLEANHLHKNILKHEIKEITNEEALQLAINKDNAHYNNLIRIDKCWDKLLDQDFAFNTILENSNNLIKTYLDNYLELQLSSF